MDGKSLKPITNNESYKLKWCKYRRNSTSHNTKECLLYNSKDRDKSKEDDKPRSKNLIMKQCYDSNVESMKIKGKMEKNDQEI